jgi:hypothetical protein
MMTKNMGGLDTAARATLGSLALVFAAVVADQRPLLAFGAAFVALVLLVTAIAGVCPLYALVGLDTRPRPLLQSLAAPRADLVHQAR